MGINPGTRRTWSSISVGSRSGCDASSRAGGASAGELVVQPAVEGVVVPFVGGLPLDLRQGLLGLQRIVDDDDVGTPPGQHPADRGGDARTLRRRLEFRNRLTLRREAGRKELLAPVADDDAGAVAREFVGEVLALGLRSRSTIAFLT
jgi:hypothetical protein